VDLTQGDDVTLGIEVFSTQSDSSDMWIDCLFFGRRDIGFNFDDTVDGDFLLDEPKQFPDLVEVGFAETEGRRKISGAEIDSTWNDTSNEQFIEVSDGETFTRFNNTESGSVAFDGSVEGATGRLGISNQDNAEEFSSPKLGDAPQKVDVWNLFGDVDAKGTDDIGVVLTRAIVAPNTEGVVNETLQEGGLFGDGELLSRSIFAEFEVLADQRIASAESTTFRQED